MADQEKKAGVGVSLIVRKRKDLLTKLIFVGLYMIWLSLTLIVYKLAGYIGFFLGGFMLIPVVIITRFLIVKLVKVEFEYVFSGGIFEVTKIEAQTNRVPVVRVPVDEMVDFGRVSDSIALEKKKECVKTIFCGISDELDTSYFFTCDVENTGLKMYIFDPDDRILNALKRYSPKIEKAARR